MIMINPFKRLQTLYWRFFVSPEQYARHIGVNIGKIVLFQQENGVVNLI